MRVESVFEIVSETRISIEILALFGYEQKVRRYSPYPISLGVPHIVHYGSF